MKNPKTLKRYSVRDLERKITNAVKEERREFELKEDRLRSWLSIQDLVIGALTLGVLIVAKLLKVFP